MDIPWLIGFLLSIDLLCGTSLPRISALSIAKDFNGPGAQYRFQYFVRDERGDYKTQEEAGEGGKSRGSYAVEEPDGNLRIVQYTANLDGGFKAHIKVDHGDKSTAKLQEIDIPAEEMRKLIEDNRKKTPVREEEEEPDVDISSKSYVLGPPRKMSDIVMEQAAAIREIISKEIEAEEQREAEERRRNETRKEGIDTVDCGEEKSEAKSGIESTKIIDKDKLSYEKTEVSSTHSPGFNEEGRLGKGIKIKEEETTSVESLRDSQILNKNSEPGVRGIKKSASPVVRVALRPRNIEDVKSEDSDKTDTNYRETYATKSSPVPSGGSPVRNFSFKNRIMFYKPAEKKTNLNKAEIKSEESEIGEKINDEFKPKANQEEIVLYSPYQDGDEGNEGNRKSKFITVPYEVLRPYLTEIIGDEERSK